MPAKKVKKSQTDKFDFQKLINNQDSYKSLIYGIVTVIVLFIVIALGVRTLQQNKAQIDDEALTTQSQEQQRTYTVRAGDTLWSIAESQYNDGFKWGEIAKANNITDATVLEEGTRLIIPDLPESEVITTVAPSSPTPTTPSEKTPTPTPMQSDKPKITTSTYTVVEGDTLWDIAIRAYGNGYRWVEIANLNKLANPDLIYVGDLMKLPRP